MRSRHRLAVMAVCVLAIASVAALRGTATSGASPTPQQEQRVDRAPVLNGEQNPEEISDDLAYRTFFYVVRDLHEQGNDRALNAYLRRAGIGMPTCETCAKVTTANSSSPDDVTALIREAQTFVAAIERETNNLRVRRATAPRGASAVQQTVAVAMQQRVVNDRLFALRGSLSPESMTKVEAFVLGHVKSRIKRVSAN